MGHLSRRTLLAAGLGAAALPPLRAEGPRELTVTAFPLVDAIVEAAKPHWARLHPDVAIRVVSRQYVDHHTAMTTALATSVYLPDVMALESTYVGRYAHGTGLEDLTQPPYGVGRFRDRFARFAYDQAVNRRGEVIAVPTDIGPGTLLYRADLLARAGLTEADLTTSWESYVQAGVKLKAATGAHLVSNAQVIKDILIRHGTRPGEGMYFDQDARVLVDSPRFVRAFEIARQVRRAGLDARTYAWSNEWAEGFKRGTLASEPSGAWLVGQLANWVAPQTKGLWRAAPLPEQTFVGYGGTYYAMPRRAAAERKALAWELIQLLTLNRERQFAAFKSQDAFPALVETYDDPFFDEPVPFLGGQRARLLWREAAKRIVATPMHKQSDFANEVINAELDNVLVRDKPIPQALADAARLLQRRASR
ncbi:MAG TPA: extracellular solute-binding protein [Ideonella sp.]|jgi:multiple sugar transport system substrate-binding protein|nr:extracellular solute-binding protein [Ideonella sp.]